MRGRDAGGSIEVAVREVGGVWRCIGQEWLEKDKDGRWNRTRGRVGKWVCGIVWVMRRRGQCGGGNEEDGEYK